MTVAFVCGGWSAVDRFEVYLEVGNHRPCDRLEMLDK